MEIFDLNLVSFEAIILPATAQVTDKPNLQYANSASQ